ncbi:MAG: ribonuclease HII [Clostridia bacterium]|nr:ribonuclease HII [Clostridia bacterium]
MTKEERIQKQIERLAEMKKPEAELHAQGYRYIAGIDEVGRGPLAGPVVTAAVVLPEDFDVLGVDDSKKLSEKRREELYDKIIKGCVAYGIGMSDHKVIDEINILQATKEAMKKAIAECEIMLGQACAEDDEQAGEIKPRRLDFALFDAVKIEGLDVPQQAIIKGDAKVLAIAAASIVAKVTRDRMMVEYAREYPWYAFESNKGYGTAAHYEGIREHGTCPIHRMSFLKNMH